LEFHGISLPRETAAKRNTNVEQLQNAEDFCRTVYQGEHVRSLIEEKGSDACAHPVMLKKA
jgi:hypothetical protein